MLTSTAGNKGSPIPKSKIEQFCQLGTIHLTVKK